jgi:hypothetical protein
MFNEPKAAEPIADERELLLRYLHRQRELVVQTTAGLTEEQLRWTPDSGLLPIIGVLNHLSHVEWRWINGRYLGEQFPARVDEFAVPASVTGAAVIAAYSARAQETNEIVLAAPSLDVACVGAEAPFPPAHVLFGYTEPLDLRWTLLHLIEETAHHAGHADATRELLDGMRMTG